MPQTSIHSVPLRHPATLLARLRAALTVAAARRHDRAGLARLDSHLLQDIGLDEEEAAEEIEKPFWRG